MKDGPGNRFQHALSYDPIGREIYLFGGEYNNTGLGDFWRYSIIGDIWCCISEGGVPEKRCHPSMVYDNATGEVYMFGGVSEDWHDDYINYNDLWKYNVYTQSWTKIDTNEGPSPRYAHTMVMDPIERCIYLYGGAYSFWKDPYGYFTYYKNDFWKFFIENNTWVLINESAEPSLYSGRSGASLIYDYTSNSLYLFGGNSYGDMLNDIWRYDITEREWNPVQNTSLNGTVPEPRHNHGYAFSETTRQLYIYGGMADKDVVLGDFWVFSVPENIWTKLSNVSNGNRSCCSMATQPTANKILLLGGYYVNQTGEDVIRGDFWEYDIKNNLWNECLSPSEPRSCGAAVYDSIFDDVYIFSGRNTKDYLNDMWRYTYVEVPRNNLNIRIVDQVEPVISSDNTTITVHVTCRGLGTGGAVISIFLNDTSWNCTSNDLGGGFYDLRFIAPSTEEIQDFPLSLTASRYSYINSTIYHKITVYPFGWIGEDTIPKAWTIIGIFLIIGGLLAVLIRIVLKKRRGGNNKSMDNDNK